MNSENSRDTRRRPTDALDERQFEPPYLPEERIEQHLDMCEARGPRGEQVSRHEAADQDGLRDLSDYGLESNFHVDMAEPAREGDDESGDEHSSGLQGDEPELQHERQIATGLPGDLTEHQEMEVDERLKLIPPDSTSI